MFRPRELFFSFLGVIFIACSNDTTEIVSQSSPNYIDVVAEESELPECVEDNEGEQILIKGESRARTCVDGKWFKSAAPGKDSVFVKTENVPCHTEELSDKRGVKVVCNGDSVGMIRYSDYGAKGDKGETGASCSLVRMDADSVRVACAGDSAVFTLKSLPDIVAADPEKIPVSLDVLIGFAQKGRFLKGSSVELFELKDGHTFEKTGKSFQGEVINDDGRYKIADVNLSSQYAIIKVKGYYLDEITGNTSKTPIELSALVNLLGQESPNINVLTHLEFERVKYLVTKEGKTFEQAKKRAQKEVLEWFYIDGDEFENSENLDVFGNTDADAALLAMSSLLQEGFYMDSLDAFLKEFSGKFETEGKWEGPRVDTLKTTIADWAMRQNFREIRKNPKNKGAYKSVGNFEKYVEKFIAKQYKLNVCDASNEGETQVVDNDMSRYHGKKLICYEGSVGIPSENTAFAPEVEYGWMYDIRDRHVYKTVKIGNQTWMAENLNYEYKIQVADGDDIVVYGNACSDDSCFVYGRYYLWSAAMDSAAVFSEGGKGCGYRLDARCNPSNVVRGACPDGWLLPNLTEWKTLLENLGYILTEHTGKLIFVVSDDSVGLSWLLVGEMNLSTKKRSSNDEMVVFWTSNEYYSNQPSLVFGRTTTSKAYFMGRNIAFSVRCIKE